MCCVSFAFANEGSNEVEPPAKSKAYYVILTSCGVAIDMHADETNDQQMLDNAIYYECYVCGDCSVQNGEDQNCGC